MVLYSKYTVENNSFIKLTLAKKTSRLCRLTSMLREYP